MGRRSTMPALLAAMKDARGTQAELQALSGLSSGSVCRHLAALRTEAPPRVRIIGWKRHPDGGPFQAIYALRHPRDPIVPDAPLPRALTEAEKSDRYRTRMRATGAWELVKARRRIRYAAAST